MGVKDLWSILTPYAERKPICDLRGKIVAIDLAGWVCESLNVVDYFVHPRHHLKNLFFRTCYLIWEEVTPVFVLEGVAPKLKQQVIKKRNQLQFRGVEPKKKKAETNSNVQCDKAEITSGNYNDRNMRTRFNSVLKQCERLLRVMGIECIQGPGEAEAYCAYLNQKGLVHGVVSQDSDCFAYGAVRVYRNFSISNQGAVAAQGGALDIYDMEIIRSKIDFGQNKVIAMALLCGCDYCPDGIGGVGRDSVLKLFNRYKDHEILQLLRRWRLENAKYAALELRLTDKNICTNCGHFGRTQCHTKKGCDVCRTTRGCDNTLWKEERLSLKAEVLLRQKAIANPNFPCEDIIHEFLSHPTNLPKLTLKWHQPDLTKFIKQIGELLQWTEIYCFQKFFPILTRWHVQNIQCIKQGTIPAIIYVSPKEILKKRIVKGLPSLEIIWKDEHHYFDNLIPKEQLQEFESNSTGVNSLWTTVEPLNLMEAAYPDLVMTYFKSQEKPKKVTRNKITTTTIATTTTTKLKKSNLNSLENLNDLLAAAEDVNKQVKSKKSTKCKKPLKKDSHLIERFFQRNLKGRIQPSIHSTSIQKNQIQCSTPLNKSIKFDLEQNSTNESDFDISGIINNIVYKTEPIFNQLTNHEGKSLFYEILSQNMSGSAKESNLDSDLKCVDDSALLKDKRSLSNSFITSIQHPHTKRIALDDSFDVLVKMGNKKHFLLTNSQHEILFDHSKSQQDSDAVTGNRGKLNQADVSYFFNNDYQDNDAFEKCMEISHMQHFENDYYVENEDDLIMLSE